MEKQKLRPLGYLRITDPRGYGYLPKILRKELNAKGKDAIPFFVDANCVLLVRKGASVKDILEGLDVLRKDVLLRFQQEKG